MMSRIQALNATARRVGKRDQERIRSSSLSFIPQIVVTIPFLWHDSIFMTMLLLFVITTLAAILSGVTGLAGGAVILASLALFYEASEALALHGLLQAVSNGLRITFSRKLIRWDVVGRFSLLLIPGAWIGGLLFNLFDPDIVGILLGLIILLAVWVPMPAQGSLRFGLNGFIGLGLMTGFFSMFAGVVGPLLNPFFGMVGIKRESMVGTKSACLLAVHVSRVGSYAGVVGMDYGKWAPEIGLLLAAVLLGQLLAGPVAKRITDAQFDRFMKVLLTVLGLKQLYSGVSGLV
jgi:uncharacterized membrane protein YfcA